MADKKWSFVEDLEEYLRKSKNPKIGVYLHGFNNITNGKLIEIGKDCLKLEVKITGILRIPFNSIIYWVPLKS